MPNRIQEFQLERPPTEGIPPIGPGPTRGQLALKPTNNQQEFQSLLKQPKSERQKSLRFQ